MINTRYHDLFTLPVDTLVNPVNYKGAMGKGLALQFKHRFPGMNMTKTRKANRQNLDCAVANVGIPIANTIIDMNLFEQQQPRQRRVPCTTDNLDLLPAQAKARPMSETAGAP